MSKRKKVAAPTGAAIGWQSTIEAGRNGWLSEGLQVEITAPVYPSDMWKGSTRSSIPHYPKRVIYWLINKLDLVPHIAPEARQAVKITLHQPGYSPLVLGHFDGNHPHAKGLIVGFHAYHKRLRREAERARKKHRTNAARYWIVSCATDMPADTLRFC